MNKNNLTKDDIEGKGSQTNSLTVAGNSEGDGSDALSVILNKLSFVTQELVSLKNEQANLTKSVFDFQKSLHEIDKKVKLQAKSITKLQSENTSLRCEVKNLNNQLNIHSQNIHTNTVRINNIPKKSDEDLFQVLFKIGQVCDYELTKDKIDFCFRTRTVRNSDTPPILLKFASKIEKDTFMYKKRTSQEKLTTDIIDSSRPKGKIFINDYMSPYYYSLYQKVNQLRVQGILKFTWFRNNKLYVKKNENSLPISIRCEEDIGKLQLSTHIRPTEDLLEDENDSDSSVLSSKSSRSVKRKKTPLTLDTFLRPKTPPSCDKA
uniref:FP protein C-terminal domain-containing protein n=1 Tax=Rhodnius prolixus TaxID=13249 RepID=T1HRS5_RHOPR